MRPAQFPPHLIMKRLGNKAPCTGAERGVEEKGIIPVYEACANTRIEVAKSACTSKVPESTAFRKIKTLRTAVDRNYVTFLRSRFAVIFARSTLAHDSYILLSSCFCHSGYVRLKFPYPNGIDNEVYEVGKDFKTSRFMVIDC